LAAFAGDAVAPPLELGQLFGVEMDQVARLLPLLQLHRGLGFQVPHPREPRVFMCRPPVERRALTALATLLRVQR